MISWAIDMCSVENLETFMVLSSCILRRNKTEKDIIKTVKILQEKGVDLSKCMSYDGDKIFYLAAEKEYNKIITFLIKTFSPDSFSIGTKGYN